MSVHEESAPAARLSNVAPGLTNTNPALFVDTTAYLVQSASGKLAILTFRGTGLQNTVNWLTDASAKPDPFFSAGRVHGGFYRAALLLWPTIRSLLQSALSGDSSCDVAMQERAKVQHCGVAPHARGEADQPGACGGDGPEALHGAGARSSPEERSGFEALYITGHSLGGALAVVAAALIHIDPDLDAIRRKVRGIYTYGQPMVGLSDFASRFDEEFGKKLLRHVYGKDIMPRLPPRTTGDFVHFGREFGSDEGGWMSARSPGGAGRWPRRAAMGLPGAHHRFAVGNPERDWPHEARFAAVALRWRRRPCGRGPDCGRDRARAGCALSAARPGAGSLSPPEGASPGAAAA